MIKLTFLARLDKARVGVGVGLGGGGGFSKRLTLKFLCDGQCAVRQAILSL